ncbi:3-deoxy-D-manno-octulosonic acid transferase [Urbifossiella limnaea]|uniref:3-deoxy-D-manno-octulosonic acid transferase n=1 Tax=Urbifossiella limnaea TaxID=2528023 RepID=A0A517XQ28_9BACT|nr:3-deoxy-D-manno-octulosonic acid transferase [Urbifossiella limnaea]QDU19586.1 3-deoxy-D-manno-octulosonic acid transferase [Urbifossiella limnaea]
MLLNVLYLAALAVLSPWLVWRCVRTGRYRRDLLAKLTGPAAVPNLGRRPVAWFHAVSVGEVNLLGTLVPAFRARHPDWLAVVSSTTDTGLAEARRRFADVPVIPWPLDFTWAAAAAFDAVNPSVLVLAESELWPNALAEAARRGVPVVVANARLSPRSARRLARVAGLARRRLLAHVTRFAVQEAEYADRLRALGVPADKLTVTGSIKYDGALKDRDTPATRALARLLGITPGAELVLLAGSTHAPEEELILTAFAALRARFPRARLLLVPRHPDRFEEVARLVEASGLPFVRRSQVQAPLAALPAVVLLDTVGELGAAWGLADVGYVGGTLDGRRGGQSMIEPAGYGVACVFGPHVWNFKDAARRLVEVGAATMIADAAGLEPALAALLADDARRERTGGAAREQVRRQQGATARTLEAIDAALSTTSRRAA